MTGPALGLAQGQRWDVRTTQLGAGDSLLSITDGVAEAVCGSGPLDSAAVRQLLQTHDDSAAGLIDALRARLDHPAEDLAADDATVLALTRSSAAPA